MTKRVPPFHHLSCRQNLFFWNYSFLTPIFFNSLTNNPSCYAFISYFHKQQPIKDWEIARHSLSNWLSLSDAKIPIYACLHQLNVKFLDHIHLLCSLLRKALVNNVARVILNSFFTYPCIAVMERRYLLLKCLFNMQIGSYIWCLQKISFSQYQTYGHQVEWEPEKTYVILSPNDPPTFIFFF